MSKDLAFKQFPLKDIAPKSVIALVGVHQTGKTSLIRQILYYMRKRIRSVILFSKSAQFNHDFDGIIPKIFIYNKFDSAALKKYIAEQYNIREQIERNPKIKKQRHEGLVIFDDVLSITGWQKDLSMVEIITQGTHNLTNFIISVQNPLAIPSTFRENIDYYFITSINTPKGMVQVFEQYWTYGDYDQFFEILKACTTHDKMRDDFKALCIVKRGANMDINKSVFYVNILPREKLKKYRIGSSKMWILDRDRYTATPIRNIFGSGMPQNELTPTGRKKVVRKVKLVNN